ncbi:MAG: tetratricopeptide repeat protein [Candidatus Zixiibacteriota bacterium]
MIQPRMILFCGLALYLAGSHQISARHIPDDIKICLNQITACIYNDQFLQAEALIDSLSRDGNARPFNFLFRSILYQSQMMAAESNHLETQFFDCLDSVEASSQRMLESGQDSALAYYFSGHSHAFRSLYQGRAGHTWSAIKKALGARKAYDKGYKADSTFHDIALGLGSYKYWKTVKTKALNWTPLFKSEKRRGIELLRLAADSSDISRDASRAALIWVYINEKQYGQAISLAGEMLKKYPHGLTFLWPLGEAYFKLGDYSQAIEIYSEIKSKLSTNPGNYFNIIEASFYLFQCYDSQRTDPEKSHAEICLLAKEIQNLPIPEETQERQMEKIKKITSADK